jgi:hypothetical protein
MLCQKPTKIHADGDLNILTGFGKETVDRINSERSQVSLVEMIKEK